MWLETEFGKGVYFIYYVASKPFKNIWKYITTFVHKARVMLNVCLVLSIVVLYWKSFLSVFFSVFHDPDFSSEYFMGMVSITILVYLWKYGSSYQGEGWKDGYNKLIAKRRGKNGE